MPAAWPRWTPNRLVSTQEIAALSERIQASAGEIAAQEASQHTLTERGYELDREGHDAQERANQAAVELERATAREHSNTERIAELGTRITVSAAELEQTRTQLAGIVEERAQQKAFLDSAAGEAVSSG